MSFLYSVNEVKELFRCQMENDVAACFCRTNLLGREKASLFEANKSEQQVIHFRHGLIENLFDVERAFCEGNSSFSNDALERLCRRLDSMRMIFGANIPCWPIRCVEVSFARLILASKVRDESILTLVMPTERMEVLLNAGETERWRTRRFRDLLICAIRVMSFLRSQNHPPDSKSDFVKNDELFANDIEYERRGSVWQLKVGCDGDFSADFDVYIPDVLAPAGIVKTKELRLSSSFNEKRRDVYLHGNLYGDDPRWSCYINHSRSHSLTWKNLSAGGLWKWRDIDEKGPTKIFSHAPER